MKVQFPIVLIQICKMVDHTIFFCYNYFNIGSDLMTYLDYSSTTPMSFDAIDTYVKVSKEYIGSISSNNTCTPSGPKPLCSTALYAGQMYSEIFFALPSYII